MRVSELMSVIFIMVHNQIIIVNPEKEIVNGFNAELYFFKVIENDLYECKI